MLALEILPVNAYPPAAYIMNQARLLLAFYKEKLCRAAKTQYHQRINGYKPASLNYANMKSAEEA